MPDAVFIETTIPSYYVAKPSRNVVQLARQELTREWWDSRRTAYDLYTSEVVLEEAADGDAVMAGKRVTILAGIQLLDIDEQVAELAAELVQRGILPAVAARDAIHIATAAVHRMQFLLTWNCKHIANPHIRERIRACFARHGVDLPVICTPEEFIGDDDHSNPET